MDEFLMALHQSAKAARGGICGLARRLGKREQTLINKLNPADEMHMPHVGELVAIIDDTGDLSPLEALAGMFGARVVTSTHERNSSAALAVIHTASETGDVSKAVEEALTDGVIDAKEHMRIMREIREARHALAVLENTLREEVKRNEIC